MKTAFRTFLIFSTLVIFTSMTFAQVASTVTPAKTSSGQATASPGKFVDNNKNGICDNHESGKLCNGKKFVDKNGDGKCDNCGATGKCKGPCCTEGQKNGNCYGNGQGKGNCCGQGHRHRNGCATRDNAIQESQPKK